jgi:arylsulfatase
MSWPQHIPQGGSLRSQFHHVTDIMPTILEAARIAPPQTFAGVRQQRMDGISMAYTFAQPKAPSQRTEMVVEMLMNLGIYKDGWFAGTTPARHAWETAKPISVPIDERKWELYHVATDFSEAHDLAAKEPARLAQMKDLFWKRAAENQMLPIHNSITGFGAEGRPSLTTGRTTFSYASRLRRVPQDTAPHVVNRSFSIEAEVTVPAGGASGAIVAQGGKYSGYTLALVDGRPVFGYNAVPPHISTVRAEAPLAPGVRRLLVDVVYDGGGKGKGATVTISADGKQVAQGRIKQTIPRWLSHTEGLDIGADTTTPVIPDYQSPAEFTGEIAQVKINLK